MDATTHSFRLAPMSPVILIVTLGVLTMMAVLFLGALVSDLALVVPGALVAGACAWVWLRFRPSLFLVRPGALEVVWPLKRRQIRREDIASVRLIEPRQLRREAGWCMRVGAGGLWGGFGWLWTERRGLVRMYISRADGLVWIERRRGRPWLITPEHAEAFVRTLADRP